MKNISIPDALAPYILGLLDVYAAQHPDEYANNGKSVLNPEAEPTDNTPENADLSTPENTDPITLENAELNTSESAKLSTPENVVNVCKEETEQEEKDLPPTPPIEKEEKDKEERRGDGECPRALAHEAMQVEDHVEMVDERENENIDKSTFDEESEEEKMMIRNDGEEREGNGATRNAHLPPKINFSVNDNNQMEKNSNGSQFYYVADNPPSLDELRAYFKESGMKNFTPEQFFDYYEARQWMMRGNIKMRNWKACMRTWNRKQVYDLTGLQNVADFREFLDKRCPLPEELTDDQEAYLTMYDPGNQYLYGSAVAVDYVLGEKKLTLRQCLGYVGGKVVERVIMQNLDDLRTFCDVPQWRFSNEHVYNVTQLILNNYSFWKTGELMLALQRLKAGKHGVVDNHLSPTILLNHLCSYEKWRLSQVNRRGR